MAHWHNALVTQNQSVEQRIADELGVAVRQVSAAVELLDGGATVPFIARYRKEATGTLDDAQLRTLEERLRYLRELDERREAILKEIQTQGKLTEELEASRSAPPTPRPAWRISTCPTSRNGAPRRRSPARPASSRWPTCCSATRPTTPSKQAANFVDPDRGVPDANAALEGARAILVERFAEDADLLGELRESMAARGSLTSKVREGQEQKGAKFADYFEFSEPFSRLPSHRILALFRGEKEEILDLTLDPGADDAENEARIAERFGLSDQGRPADPWLAATVHWAWRTRILMHLSVDIRVRLWQAAEDEAVRVFAANLRDLLLAAPAGARTTIGLDPGFRTGVKVAITDATGKVLGHRDDLPARAAAALGRGHRRPGETRESPHVELIAIGNGTASRETDRLAADLIKRHPDLKLTKVVVSEAGASVYSASAYASEELPGLDVSLRGAVSIARRLQDPLAELVKIDPKSIGVGQYQHDVAEGKLSHSLDAVVEDCVNAVGVDLNTASQPLLARVSGITAGLATAIVARRDSEGPFSTRKQLMRVPRLGPKAFEQCAGFLRIRGGDDPLDASGVHPEAYPVVRRILAATGSPAGELIGSTAVLRGLRPEKFTDDRFGLPTVTDILRELEKPGRDPRPAFATATFAEGVEKLEDLEPGMVLEGVVTNVAAFGAFVDVGVHQDGLVHVSAMSRNFVSDPHSVVKSGDVVRVKVLSVDIPRHRISLTLRLDDEGPRQAGGRQRAEDRLAALQPNSSRTGRGSSSRSGASGSGSGRPEPRTRRPRMARWPTPCAGPA